MREPGATGRVEDEHLTAACAGLVGVVNDVGLDRRGECRPVPLEDRGHDQPCALAGLGGPDTEHRRAGLRCDQLAVACAERDPPGLGPRGAQVCEVAARRPTRAAVTTAADPVQAARNQYEHSRNGCEHEQRGQDELALQRQCPGKLVSHRDGPRESRVSEVVG